GVHASALVLHPCLVTALISWPLSPPSLSFFHAPATTDIYTLSLHDALPICHRHVRPGQRRRRHPDRGAEHDGRRHDRRGSERHRSEEHTSELQSPDHLVCRLLLEKKKKK